MKHEQAVHTSSRRLQKNESNRIISGVAAGLADYLQVDVSIVRFMFILLVFFNFSSIFAYCAFVIVFPNDTNPIDTDPEEKIKTHNMLAIWASILVLVGSSILAVVVEIPIIIQLWSLSFLASLAIFLLVSGVFLAYLVYIKYQLEFENMTFQRSSSDRLISGVLGGFANYTFIDVTVLRSIVILALILLIKLLPLFVLAYFTLSLFTTEKLD
jgi:phage shock protein PspC (stress-responsive transcriptional regulator)